MAQLIKRAAIDAVEAAKPVAFLFGVVVSVNPLEINVDQKMSIKQSHLIVPEHLTDYKVQMKLAIDQEVLVKNALKKGDRVILARLQGGQKFVVVDRMVGV